MSKMGGGGGMGGGMGGGGGNSLGGRLGVGARTSSMGPDRGRSNFAPMMQSPQPNFGGPGMPSFNGMPPQFLDMMFSMLPDPVRAKFAGVNQVYAPGQRQATEQTKTGGGQDEMLHQMRALFGNRGW